MVHPHPTAKAPGASCSVKQATRLQTLDLLTEAFSASQWPPTGPLRPPPASVYLITSFFLKVTKSSIVHVRTISYSILTTLCSDLRGPGHCAAPEHQSRLRAGLQSAELHFVRGRGSTYSGMSARIQLDGRHRHNNAAKRHMRKRCLELSKLHMYAMQFQ